MNDMESLIKEIRAYEDEYRKCIFNRKIEGTEDILKRAADAIESLMAKTEQGDNKCYGCFGAANNDCQRCDTERGLNI